MANVSISEAARLAGKSRTTLHRLIKTGELSVSTGDRNAKMIDVSELCRVFPAIRFSTGEHQDEQVSEQRLTGAEQDNARLKQEVEHLKALVSSQQSHIESLKQAMLLIEHKQQSEQANVGSDILIKPRSRWAFWRK